MRDWEAWCAAVHGVAKSWKWLSNWTTLVLPETSQALVPIYFLGLNPYKIIPQIFLWCFTHAHEYFPIFIFSRHLLSYKKGSQKSKSPLAKEFQISLWFHLSYTMLSISIRSRIGSQHAITSGVSCRIFIVLLLKFMSQFFLKLMYLCWIRKESNFIFFPINSQFWEHNPNFFTTLKYHFWHLLIKLSHITDLEAGI